jgi:DnaJ family protein C protein 28
MDKYEPLIDRMIRESMDRGEFDDLPGSGQPIDLSENPYEKPELRSVHRLLKNAGFAPAWIEERKDIDAEFQRLYAIVQRAHSLYDSKAGDVRWQRALKEFREHIEELNQRIRLYNLKAPAIGFHRQVIDIDSLIADLEKEKSKK